MTEMSDDNPGGPPMTEVWSYHPCTVCGGLQPHRRVWAEGPRHAERSRLVCMSHEARSAIPDDARGLDGR